MHTKTAITPDIARAAQILRDGGVVAFPTETIYGLGADARDARAVLKIYEIKSRPSFNPLIVHVKDRIGAEQYAVFDDRARLIADMFWPGPLTLVLPLRAGAGIADVVTAGLETVAIRVPAHPAARQLLAEFGGPVAAPSANRSGELSPTTPAHVRQSLGDLVPFIVNAGASPVGLESTILDLTFDPPVILRAGAVTPDDLSSVLGRIPDIASVGRAGDEERPKSPGLLLRHYAPRARLRLRAVDVRPGEALLAFGDTRFMGVQGGGFARDLPEEMFRNLSESGDLTEAAANLFKMLHELDRPGCAGIAVMDIPDVGIGIAINDRLRRGASERE